MEKTESEKGFVLEKTQLVLLHTGRGKVGLQL